MYNLNLYHQLWEYKVEEKLYLGIREQKGLITTNLDSRLIDYGEVRLTLLPPFTSRKIPGTQSC
jgi:hypothetical protein